MKVSVSILGEIDNFECSIDKINKTSCDYLHLDIMDGTFTEKTTFSFNQSEKIKKLSAKKLDVHIMSTNLDTILDEYIKLNPNYITFHVENKTIEKYIKKIKENNIKVGLAINPNTNIDKLRPYLSMIDLVLVMSVEPGKSGQAFILDILPKLEELYNLKKKYNYLIEVDGGINSETVKYVKDYADILVLGSYVTNSANYQDRLQTIENCC